MKKTPLARKARGDFFSSLMRTIYVIQLREKDEWYDTDAVSGRYPLAVLSYRHLSNAVRNRQFRIVKRIIMDEIIHL